MHIAKKTLQHLMDVTDDITAEWISHVPYKTRNRQLKRLLKKLYEAQKLAQDALDESLPWED